jgi:NAD(P)-dependent dehydrogenase (short-subunit alcohol dehydrogenase family)
VTEEFVDRLGFGRPSEAVDRPLTATMDLSGRVAFVTGGGQGLGSATALRLAEQGAPVAVCDLSLEKAESVAANLARRFGNPAMPIQCDVTDPSAVRQAMTLAKEALGPIAILVNNVGGGGPSGLFYENELDEIEASVRLNLLSQLFATRIALEDMLANGGGAIVNVASNSGIQPFPQLAVYGACKAAIVGFTHNLAHDLRGTGVRVNAVCPGIILSPILEERARAAADGDIPPIEWSLATSPLGRGSLPTEVANAIAFLVSDAASAVHGAVYTVGGN